MLERQKMYELKHVFDLGVNGSFTSTHVEILGNTILAFYGELCDYDNEISEQMLFIEVDKEALNKTLESNNVKDLLKLKSCYWWI